MVSDNCGVQTSASSVESCTPDILLFIAGHLMYFYPRVSSAALGWKLYLYILLVVNEQ